MPDLFTDQRALVGGLEVFHRATETWNPVQPVEGAFVVNIGDMLGTKLHSNIEPLAI